jgi:hypothetical protein
LIDATHQPTEVLDQNPPRRRLGRRLTRIFVALAALVVLGFGFVSLTGDSTKRAAEAKYQAIKPGMTRAEIRQLVQGLGGVMYTGVGPVELMHIDDARYLIAVYYMPDPKDPSPTIYPNGIPHDRWVVKEKLFLELGRTGTFDQLVTGLNLKPERSLDRSQTP